MNSPAGMSTNCSESWSLRAMLRWRGTPRKDAAAACRSWASERSNGKPDAFSRSAAPLSLPSPHRVGRGWPEAGRGVGNALPGPSGATLRLTCRGLGLLVALELRGLNGEPATEVALKVVKDLLRKGFIFLPEGEHANVIGFTPPLTVSEAQLRVAVNALASALGLEPINKPRG